MSSTKSSVEISAKDLQKIYDVLKPAANLVRMNGNVSEDDKKKFEKAPVDLFLSETEATQYATQTSQQTFGFKWDRTWYGDAETLSEVYSQIVKIDQADGKFDGLIEKRDAPYSLFLQNQSDVNWNIITEPLVAGVFDIDTESKRKNSGGTGWIIEKEVLANGVYRYYIATNAHVADNIADHELSWKIQPEGSAQKISLTLLGVDQTWDCAFLYFDSKEEFPVFPVNPDAPVKINDFIMIIGNQLGNGIIQTKGQINSVEKYKGWDMRLIQDDSSALPGNSGSPVLNSQGEVIAVCNSGQYSGENYNIPIAYFLESFEQIKKQGYAEHGYFVNSFYKLDENEMELKNLDSSVYPRGFLIDQVRPNSQMDKAGIKIGDIIIKYDGELIPQDNEWLKFSADIAAKKPGSTMELTVLRDGKELTFDVVLSARVENQLTTYTTPYDFNLVEMTDEQKFQNGLQQTPGLVYQYIWYDKNNRLQSRFEGILDNINGKKVQTLEEVKTIITDSTIEKFVFEYIVFDEDGPEIMRKEVNNANY